MGKSQRGARVESANVFVGEAQLDVLIGWRAEKCGVQCDRMSGEKEKSVKRNGER